MKPAIKKNSANTYHNDGTVSHWNVYSQTWERLPAIQIASNVLASMSEEECQAVRAHVAK